MQVMLKVLSGCHEGRELSVSGEKFLIGRSESCQLRPKSESVSRKHCIIVLKDNRVLIPVSYTHLTLPTNREV